ncbi:MAG: ATP-binding protein [Planctomycetota bacterium]|nr:ATP-binding protein [Planctomycetota bacterium]
MASFFVIRGKDNGQHFAIRGSNASLGRDATNQIQLRDNEVSRKHARIIRTGDVNYELVDNRSSNGTFVNGRRVTSHPLRSGDRVRLGRTLLIFTGGPELQSTYSIDAVEIVSDAVENDLSQIRSSIHGGSALGLSGHGDVSLSDMELNPSGKALQESEDASSESVESESRTGSDWKPSISGSDLEVVYQVGLAIHRTVDLGELLNHVLELIFESIACDRGCILMLDDNSGDIRPIATLDRKQLEIRQTSGNSQRPALKPLRISQTILEHVRESQEGVLTCKAQDDVRWEDAESVTELGIHEAICVPMLGRYGLVGAIYVDTSVSPGIFAERDAKNTFEPQQLKLMMAIAGQAALAIEDTQFYRAMVQAERLAVMGQTIANLSHHVKNILQGVSGGNYLIEAGLEKEDFDVVRKGWKTVQRNQARISHLVMDMLSFSKDREPNMEAGDVREIVDEVCNLMESRAVDAKVDLTWNRPKHEVRASFESEGIHRSLLNVLTNAIDACTEVEKGQIEIEVEVKGSMVHITVMDNGPGIAEEDQPLVFVPFESTKGAGGTGLGLPVSQKILREHGGDLTFQTQVGRGTAFVLFWPVLIESDGPVTLIE